MHKLIEEACRRYPERTALIFNGRSLDFRWLAKRAKDFAAYLMAHDIELFAMGLHNSPVNVIAYLAAGYAGCDLLAINPRLKDYEMALILNKSRPGVVLFSEDQVTDLLEESLAPHLPMILTVEAEDPMKGDFWQALDMTLNTKGLMGLKDACIYHLTSGANGFAKMCEHRVSQFYHYAHNRAKDMGYLPSDKLLISLSLNHAFAFSYQLLPAMALGLPCVILKAFDEVAMLKVMISEEVTSLALLPTMTYLLAIAAEDRFKDGKAPDFTLRYPLVAGDALPSAFNNRFEKVFKAPLYQGIGMTEVLGYAQNTPENHRPESSGKLFASVDIEIRDDAGQVLPPLTPGNVFLKNEATLLSYYLDPGISARDLKGGWLNTMDVGYVDDARYFYFMGRKKQIIVRGGSNIAPVEVEAAFYHHPDVLQAAVVGKKDPVWGQVVWAYVVTKKGFSGSEQGLLDYCRPFLADYKLPEKILFVDALPRNATGKIDRVKLQILADGNG